MRNRFRSSALGTVLLLAGAGTAEAQLWYNGDFDDFNGILSARIGTEIDARVYDNFTVSGTGWRITALYGEFAAPFVPTQAYWEIRSGITPGFGGTLLHSVTSSVTSVAHLGVAFDLDHFGVRVGGFDPFDIGPGAYWMTIALVSDAVPAYLLTTDGSNGVNAVTDFAFFFDAPFYGAEWADGPTYVGFGTDFVLGLDGSSLDSVVPEPSTVVLLATGLALVALAGWRRQRRGG